MQDMRTLGHMLQPGLRPTLDTDRVLWKGEVSRC